jgi:hypothetical protein
VHGGHSGGLFVHGAGHAAVHRRPPRRNGNRPRALCRTRSIRLFGDKDYPPKRGRLMTISETEGVLYTRGTVGFYKTYPGMYVPAPLKITVYEQDSSLESLCDEILGLTKMNWNNTQMDGRLPITLECARKIGDIMKYVSPTEKPQVSYSFYM